MCIPAETEESGNQHGAHAVITSKYKKNKKNGMPNFSMHQPNMNKKEWGRVLGEMTDTFAVYTTMECQRR